MPVSLKPASGLAPIEGEHFDIVVIGGGIIGAGIAPDAGVAGLRVALFEKSDSGCRRQERSAQFEKDSHLHALRSLSEKVP